MTYKNPDVDTAMEAMQHRVRLRQGLECEECGHRPVSPRKPPRDTERLENAWGAHWRHLGETLESLRAHIDGLEGGDDRLARISHSVSEAMKHLAGIHKKTTWDDRQQLMRAAWAAGFEAAWDRVRPEWFVEWSEKEEEVARYLVELVPEDREETSTAPDDVEDER